MSSSTPLPPSSDGPIPTKNLKNPEVVERENELTKCLLSQYRFCAASIGLGTAYSLRYKQGIMPMVAAGAIGTSVDLVYGYIVECAQHRDPLPWEEEEK